LAETAKISEKRSTVDRAKGLPALDREVK